MRLLNRRSREPGEPDARIVGRLMEADDVLRVRLADPDGSHARAVLADIKRQAGGESVPVPSPVPVLVGAGGPVLPEEAPGDADPRPAPGRPVAAGLSRKPAWYLPFALLTDLLGVGVPFALVLRHTGQDRPLLCALVAAAAWAGVRAARRRYASGALGEIHTPLPALGDWLVLLGVLALLGTAAGVAAQPVSALAGLAAGPVLAEAAGRFLKRHLTSARRSGNAVRRVLVVGEPGAADAVVDRLAARTEHAYVVVGVVPVGGDRPRSGAPVLGRLGAADPPGPGTDASVVLGAVRAVGAEVVLVAPGARLSAERLRRLGWSLDRAGLPLAVLPGLSGVAARRIALTSVAGLPLLTVVPSGQGPAQSLAKDVLDRIVAALALVLLAPVFVLVALAIRLDSPGPVFFRQTRIGRHREPFKMLKFRTMVRNARAVGAGLPGVDETDGLMFKIRRDPRVTRVGAFLRRWSLDELPQLVNVLKGDMSIVGPRPPLPAEAARYGDVELRRLSVKPGITGPWQVSGRSDLSWDETVNLDLYYVDNWSVGADLGIMLRTLRAVADGRGAY